MLLAFGVVSALLETSRSGQGQVIDAAMVDGAALLAASIHGLKAHGSWHERGTNMLDTGAWFYEVYETADGKYVSIGAIEPDFLEELVRRTGLAEDGKGAIPHPLDRTTWPAMKTRMADLIRRRTRDEWCDLMEGCDACFAPVLSPEEAFVHPHNSYRRTFVDSYGFVQPAPAPRFSRTPAQIFGPPARPGDHTDVVLAAWGLPADDIARLREAGAIC
jgi:alpha-methylacyl-CoA racemase